MKRFQRLSLSFILVFAMMFGTPATFAGYGNPAVTVAEAKHHDSSHHKKKAKIVYITETGECYHTHKCGNGTYFKSTLKKAKNLGLRACKKCF